jgi:hypothetical protein
VVEVSLSPEQPPAGIETILPGMESSTPGIASPTPRNESLASGSDSLSPVYKAVAAAVGALQEHVMQECKVWEGGG